MVDDEAADGDAAADGDGQPPPWLGAGRPPRGPARKRHVRVVIRVHHLQEEATRSLIWALRGQTQPGAEKERFSVDFALVATERKGLPVVRRIARGACVRLWCRVGFWGWVEWLVEVRRSTD